MALHTGERVLDRYEVQGLLGAGAMSEVYRARDRELGTAVAIKAIAGDASPELLARFAHEIAVLARVRHPNVVQILDAGPLRDGGQCMVLEFLEGEALDARLACAGALPWPEVRAIGLAVLDALDAVHAAGIVHRDLKPENVLLARDERGACDLVKLVDFGVAQSIAAPAPDPARGQATLGTPAYMAPEQASGGAADARSDLYALGLLLYELLAGRLPFGDDAGGVLRRLREPLPPPAVPRGLPRPPDHAVAAVLRALALDPASRPQSARELHALLRGA